MEVVNICFIPVFFKQVIALYTPDVPKENLLVLEVRWKGEAMLVLVLVLVV